MKFGVREICDVVFKTKAPVTIGGVSYVAGQPVFTIDTAKTSTMEGAATTVYATGGRGNTRLIAWEGEKTLTFTVEDALLSPESFAVLSGAGILKGEYGGDQHKIHVHKTTRTTRTADKEIDLTSALGSGETICGEAPIFIMTYDKYEDGFNEVLNQDTIGITVDSTGKKIVASTQDFPTGTLFIDYYVIKDSSTTQELQITPDVLGVNFYVEASTLFKRQSDGADMPAELTFPNVKIQSNFTFSMASTGDPSTFTFTMDAFPGYTYFNKNHQVLCAMQIIEDTATVQNTSMDSVFPHYNTEKITESENDSVDPYAAV